MIDYDDGVLFAVIAACLYTEDPCLATGGPLDLVSEARSREDENAGHLPAKALESRYGDLDRNR